MSRRTTETRDSRYSQQRGESVQDDLYACYAISFDIRRCTMRHAACADGARDLRREQRKRYRRARAARYTTDRERQPGKEGEHDHFSSFPKKPMIVDAARHIRATLYDVVDPTKRSNIRVMRAQR